jgi:hypothetical protein
LHLRKRSDIIAFAAEREAGTKEFSSLTAQEKLKKVLDNRNGLM